MSDIQTRFLGAALVGVPAVLAHELPPRATAESRAARPGPVRDRARRSLGVAVGAVATRRRRARLA